MKVTRRGQTTIPVEIRRRYRIREGSRLLVEARDDEIVMKPVPNLEDLAGCLAGKMTYREAVAFLDEMERDED